MNLTQKEEKEISERILENRRKVSGFIKITLPLLAAAVLALVVMLVIDIAGFDRKLTLEAGDKLPSASEITGHAGAKYEYDEDAVDITVPGEYEIYAVYGNKRVKVRLTVQDTTAPKADVRELTVNKDGPYPAAIDFFDNIVDASEVTAKFSDNVNVSECGSYEVSLVLSDAYSNKRTYKTVINVIIDTTPPVITGPSAVIGYVGEAVAYRKDITVTDNCFGEVTLEVDSSKVNASVVGIYTAVYTATDKSGNSSRLELPVEIRKEQISREKLMEKIESIISTEKLISSSMTKEEQVKAVYNYVKNPTASASDARIRFTDESNTDRTDWMYEAWLTLSKGEGDCYSYFSVSKAFFEYLGIENKDIQRTPDGSGTHFWSMVNIGTSSNPKWYYYDSTRLAGHFSVVGDNSCLFTEAQLESYQTSNGTTGFYKYNHSGYPTVETAIINNKYSWS